MQNLSNMTDIENILKDLMTTKCVGCKSEVGRCAKNGHCDGMCAHFVKALMTIEEITNKDK